MLQMAGATAEQNYKLFSRTNEYAKMFAVNCLLKCICDLVRGGALPPPARTQIQTEGN
jgi:hypothetical protein